MYNYSTIFHEDWWLDVVAKDQWELIELREKEGILARMPIVYKRKFGLDGVGMPALTQYLGPQILAQKKKPAEYLNYEISVLKKLIEMMPGRPYVTFHCMPQFRNGLPFVWAGFKNEVNYTHVIEDLKDLDAVWGGLRSSVRRNIRKAERHLEVVEVSANDAIDLTRATYQRQGLSMPYSPTMMENLIEECQQRNCGKALGVRGQQGNLHSVAFFVHDELTCYYLFGGADTRFRSSGGQSLLMWEGIRHASSVCESYDFMGSMQPSIAKFFRNFGARQVPYFRINKINRFLRFVQNS